MPNNQIATTDTIAVFNYCLEGESCVNHNHGIIDTTYYLYANVGASKSYFKVMPSELDNSVNCENLYKDVFGNIFYLEPDIKQTKNVMDSPKLTSFDSIEVGTKIFPAATPFVPKYFSHKESQMPTQNHTEMMYDVSCFTTLVLITIVVATNNAWGKLWKEITSA